MTSQVDEVATDVFFVRGTEVNWILLREGTDLTLVDTGYPGDVDRVEESVRAIGRRPADVRAVLLTHAHIDHIGGANHFHDRYAAAVYTDTVEAAHARREFLEQAGARDMVLNLVRPGLLPWLARVLRVGAAKNVRVAGAQPFPNLGAVDVPGRPVPVPTRGHTSGHTAYHLPRVGAVITGDELVTGHAVLPVAGQPQVLPGYFNHGDPARAIGALQALDADLVLPGHGAPLRMPIAEAVERARGQR